MDLLEIGYFLYMEEQEKKQQEAVVGNKNATPKENEPPNTAYQK